MSRVLQLNRETLRLLQADDLSQLVGGEVLTYDTCISAACPPTQTIKTSISGSMNSAKPPCYRNG